MKRKVFTIFFMFLTTIGFSQQVDKDGRAVLSSMVIKELGDIVHRQMNYASNRDMFKATMVRNIIRQTGGNVSDALSVLEQVTTSKQNRDLVINSVVMYSGINRTGDAFLSWGMTSKSVNAIEYYINSGMGSSAKERADMKKKEEKQLAQEKRDNDRRIAEENLKADQQLKKRNEEERQRRLADAKQQEKVKLLRSKVYELETTDVIKYNGLKSRLIDSLISLISLQPVTETQTIKSTYSYVYTDEPGRIRDGKTYLTHSGGNTIEAFSEFKMPNPSFTIEGVEVPINVNIKDIGLNYKMGNAQIKVTDSKINYQKGKSTAEIQSVIASKMSGKTGVYSIEYMYGDVSGSPIKVVNEKFIRKSGHWLIYPIGIPLAAGAIYLLIKSNAL
ncbi:hypothetical protein [Daejeonella sp.]|uniref:hypothetical protein n=1 Tax=Daejeonella sp. TaxID=2805397 RepID=UPI0030C2948F